MIYKSGCFLDEDLHGRIHFLKSFDHMLESSFEEFSCTFMIKLIVQYT